MAKPAGFNPFPQQQQMVSNKLLVLLLFALSFLYFLNNLTVRLLRLHLDKMTSTLLPLIPAKLQPLRNNECGGTDYFGRGCWGILKLFIKNQHRSTSSYVCTWFCNQNLIWMYTWKSLWMRDVKTAADKLKPEVKPSLGQKRRQYWWWSLVFDYMPVDCSIQGIF